MIYVIESEVGHALFIFIYCFIVGIFLFGMTVLRIGLFNLSGGTIESSWLTKLTNKPVERIYCRNHHNGLLQSSSAVMVITVGLVSARIS